MSWRIRDDDDDQGSMLWLNRVMITERAAIWVNSRGWSAIKQPSSVDTNQIRWDIIPNFEALIIPWVEWRNAAELSRSAKLSARELSASYSFDLLRCRHETRSLDNCTHFFSLSLFAFMICCHFLYFICWFSSSFSFLFLFAFFIFRPKTLFLHSFLRFRKPSKHSIHFFCASNLRVISKFLFTCRQFAAEHFLLTPNPTPTRLDAISEAKENRLTHSGCFALVGTHSKKCISRYKNSRRSVKIFFLLIDSTQNWFFRLRSTEFANFFFVFSSFFFVSAKTENWFFVWSLPVCFLVSRIHFWVGKASSLR